MGRSEVCLCTWLGPRSRNVYLVGGEFGNKFFNFFHAHIIYVIRYIHESIIAKLRHFVNRPIKNNKKTTGYDK